MIDDEVYGNLTEEKVDAILESYIKTDDGEEQK